MRSVFVFAMPEEELGLFRVQKIISGIGAINATLALTKYLSSNAVDIVINVGTCGSSIFPKGEIINPTLFRHADCDQMFKICHETFTGNKLLDHSVTCVTVSRFDKSSSFECVDMEAYALAKVCDDFNIPFTSIKYVTDGCNSNADLDFLAELQKAPHSLLDFCKKKSLF